MQEQATRPDEATLVEIAEKLHDEERAQLRLQVSAALEKLDELQKMLEEVALDLED